MKTLPSNQPTLNAAITLFDRCPAQLPATELATAILAEVMRFRRVAGPGTCCARSPCLACMAPHLPKNDQMMADFGEPLAPSD